MLQLSVCVMAGHSQGWLHLIVMVISFGHFEFMFVYIISGLVANVFEFTDDVFDQVG